MQIFSRGIKKKEQPSQIHPKMQTSAVIQTSLPGENHNYFELKGITLVAFDWQSSTTSIYIFARNLLGSLPGVGKREQEIVAGEHKKLLENSLFCSSSKHVTFCSDCSRPTSTSHCINSHRVQLFNDWGCQSNLSSRKCTSIFFSLTQHSTFTSTGRPKNHLLLTFHLLLTDTGTQLYFLIIPGSALCFLRVISTSFWFCFFIFYNAQWDTAINNLMEIAPEIKMLNNFSYTFSSWNKHLKPQNYLSEAPCQ